MAMVITGNVRSKRVRPMALALLMVTGLTAVSLPQPEVPECQALLTQIDREFDIQYESGRGDWAALDPLIAEAHHCFGNTRTPEHADLFNYETSVLVKQRRFAEAEAIFERFFNDYVHVAAPGVIALMHRRRGYVYERLGWTVAMLVEFNKAAALVDRLPPAEAANTLRNVGEQYRLVNNLGTAQRYFAQAESLLVPLYAERPAVHGADLGVVKLRQANAVLEEGQQGKRTRQEAATAAGPLVESALTLIPQTPDHAFYRTRALLTLAEVHWGHGRPTDALAPIAEAQRLAPMIRATYPALVAMAWRCEGRTHLLLGDYAAAREAYRRAVELAEVSLENEETMKAIVGLGEALEAEADLDAAEQYYRRAVVLAEQVRQSYGTHDWSASAWTTTQLPYLRLTRVLLQQGRAAEAFLTLDETRARYLRDLRTSSRLRARLDVQEVARISSLSAALDSVRYDLRNPTLGFTERATLEARELTLQQRIDAITGPPEAGTTLTLEAVQRALQPRGQVLLTYFLDEALPTAFVVRADTFAAVPLPVSPDALQTEVSRLGGLWAEDGAPDVRVRLTPLHTLYQALYAPVASLVPENAPLVVIPDGPLTQIPFGLLLERAHPPFDYADAPYLSRHHPIAVELAAAMLTEPAPTAERPLSLLALGRSRFGALELAPGSAGPLVDLPNVREELGRLRRLGSTRIALDAEATEAFFDAHRDRAHVIHLASHAFVDAQHPLYSHVVLSEDLENRKDGLLFLYELQGRPLNASLVTLSGCSTARGRSNVGEGMMGLQYAFRAAGARATLATLWQVEDAATGALMDRFYTHLRAGLPKDEALRQAQLDYLERHDGLDASPFFWAAAVLYGDPAPVPLTAGAPSALLWIPLGLLLLIAGVALPRAVARMHGRKRG